MQQRQRGELVPIGDALSGMGGPVKAIRDASPQALHHFTQADQVNQLVQASEADADLRVAGRLVRFCTLSGAFLTSVEGDRAPVSDGS